MCCFGAGVWGMNLLSRLRSSKLASTVLGDVVKVIRTLGGVLTRGPLMYPLFLILYGSIQCMPINKNEIGESKLCENSTFFQREYSKTQY